MDLEPSTVLGRVSDLYGRNDYADVTIIYGEERNLNRFRGHSNIICSSSGFFRGAFCNGFKEAKTKVIKLPASEYDPDAVESMLIYMYTDDYPMRARPIADPAPAAALALDPLVEMATAIRAHTERVNSVEEHYHKDGHRITVAGIAVEHHLADEVSHHVLIDDLDHNDEEPLLHVKVYKIADQLRVKGLDSLAQRKLIEHLRCKSTAEDLAEVCKHVYDPKYLYYVDRGLKNLIIQLYREQKELFWEAPVQNVLQSEDGKDLKAELLRVAEGRPPAL